MADGFFMTVITMSTVGYGETHDLTVAGRCFTAILIFLCVISMTCWSAALTSFIVGNDLGGTFLKRRTQRMIDKLKQHTIVCGGGMMGQAVIAQLLRKRLPVVLIEKDAELVELMRKKFPRLLVLHGSATNELTLADANVLEAKHVVAVMHSEVDNLLVAITCKDMGHDIRVYARSNDMTIANRLRKANADEVISPSHLGGNRIAELIMA
jgi:voltage-gated potassium channel